MSNVLQQPFFIGHDSVGVQAIILGVNFGPLLGFEVTKGVFLCEEEVAQDLNGENRLHKDRKGFEPAVQNKTSRIYLGLGRQSGPTY